MEDKPANVIRETDGEAINLARTLVRSARFGAIAVIEPDSGVPLASRVGVATDADGTPIILVSGLSAHTKALITDPRCSLLLGEPGKGDALAYPRISLICRAVKLEAGSPERARAEWRYLSRNPKAKLYVGLPDFSFFRLEVERASLNGGFGKAYLLNHEDLIVGGPIVEELAAIEQRAVDHMNDDHLDAIANYARFFAKADGSGWIMSGLDVDGVDLVAGDQVRRVLFPAPLQSAAEMRPMLVEMAKQARAAEQ